MAASVEADLAHAVGMLRAGATASETWERLAWPTDAAGLPEVPDRQLRSAIHAGCALSRECGASLATVLAAVGDYAQARAQVDQDIATAIEGPRVSALVLQWLPVAGLGLASLIDTGVLRLLFTTALGWLLLGAAAALTWAGRRWTTALLTSATAATDRHALDMLLVITLLRAALASGADVVSALRHVGAVIPPPHGPELTQAADHLNKHGQWQQAWSHASSDHAVEVTLRHAWLHGMDPGPLCESTLVALRMRAVGESRRAVARLTVSLSFPLTVCFLPAFGLVGVLPLILAVAQTAAITLA